MSKSIKTFRTVAKAEGISFLILLFIAMPLKYFAGVPEAVKYTGWIHGVLFVVYIPALLVAARPLQWGIQMVFIGFVASLIPGGTFLLDKEIGKEFPQ